MEYLIIVIVLVVLVLIAGGAMLVPVGRLVLARAFDKADLVKVMSFVATASLVGPMIGLVTPGCWAHHASASCASVHPLASTIGWSCSTRSKIRSLSLTRRWKIGLSATSE